MFTKEKSDVLIDYSKFNTPYFQLFAMLLIYQNPLSLNFAFIISLIKIVFQHLFLYCLSIIILFIYLILIYLFLIKYTLNSNLLIANSLLLINLFLSLIV